MLDLFTGKTSLRTRGEWLSLGVTLAFAPAIAFVAGKLWHETLGVSSAAILIVGAMIYITIARGGLMGSCVMVSKEQFPEVFAVTELCASMLELPMPTIFLRDDIHVPVVAMGFGEPYSLVVSSHWLEHFEQDELTFDRTRTRPYQSGPHSVHVDS